MIMRLIFLKLNEIIFNGVRFYINRCISLSGFKKLIDQDTFNANAEAINEHL